MNFNIFKAGKEKTAVSWAKKAVSNYKFTKRLNTIIGSDVDPEEQIKALQKQKISAKFHHVRTKTLCKSMKEVKNATVKKLNRRIKELQTQKNDQEVEKIQKELSVIKETDHAQVSNFAFFHFVLKDEYLQEKLTNLGITEEIEEQKTSSKIDLSPKMSSCKAFQDAVKAERQDLILFFKKLFHEKVESQRDQKKQNNDKPVQNKKLESCFVTSLNASGSDSEADSYASTGAVGGMVFTDDEDGSVTFDGYSDSEDDEDRKPKKKKNRLGQLARRRLAEKLYGEKAKHIQSGGLTVKQREEQRKQRIAQRRAREARIEKQAKREKEAAAAAAKGKKVTKQISVAEPEQLHPSWAAKLKNQSRINQTAFQGKKIKFSDDAEEEPKQVQKQETKKQESAKADPSLHPSWAAKLQQKTNVAFQGQKIKFEDDE